MSRQFLLHVQVPLLHVRPIGPVWNRVWVYGEGETSADIGIALHVALIGDQHERRSALLQHFGVGFVPVFVLKEYSVSAAYGHFSIALRIKGKADTGRGIHVLVLEAALGCSAHTALNVAVENIA